MESNQDGPTDGDAPYLVETGGESDLVGADDEHDAFHVGLRAHFLLHLPQPAVEGIETLPEAHVVNQQHPLTVLVELVPHLRGKNKQESITITVERRQRSS